MVGGHVAKQNTSHNDFWEFYMYSRGLHVPQDHVVHRK